LDHLLSRIFLGMPAAFGSRGDIGPSHHVVGFTLASPAGLLRTRRSTEWITLRPAGRRAWHHLGVMSHPPASGRWGVVDSFQRTRSRVSWADSRLPLAL